MIIDNIQNIQQYKGSNQLIDIALDYIKTIDFTSVETGKHSIKGDEIYAMVFDYDTKDEKEAKLEAHQQYIDVQYVAAGCEKMGYANIANHAPCQAYSQEEDYALYDVPASFVEMPAGMFAIFYPNDLHMPGITIQQTSPVRKVVVKVKA